MRVTKKPLFRFETSRHAISVTSYMREQRDIELARGEEPVASGNRHFEEDQPSLSQHLVCKPNYHNITGGSKFTSHSLLHVFLVKIVNHPFIMHM